MSHHAPSNIPVTTAMTPPLLTDEPRFTFSERLEAVDRWLAENLPDATAKTKAIVFNAWTAGSSAGIELAGLRLREERTWQPIESAPKDGTRIIAVAEGEVSVCWYGKGSGWDNEDFVGWQNDLSYGFDIEGWMPCPALPTLKEGEQPL